MKKIDKKKDFFGTPTIIKHDFISIRLGWFLKHKMTSFAQIFLPMTRITDDNDKNAKT